MAYEEKCKKSVSSGINAVKIVNTNKQLKINAFKTCLTIGSWVGGSYSLKKLELCIPVAPAIDAVCLLMELFYFLNVFFSSFFFSFIVLQLQLSY